MRNSLLVASAALALAVAPLQAQFAPTGSFGSLPANSFGGNGIPTDAVMLGGVDNVTIGLSATQRYNNPALTNNGAGTYYATPGQDPNGPASRAKWNFDFFVGGSNASNYFYTLFVDNNPAANNALGGFNSAAAGADSWNIGFGFIGGNPLATGEYNYALIQYSDAARSNELSRVAINVDVLDVTTPEPASLVLLGTGLIGIVGVARRRRA